MYIIAGDEMVSTGMRMVGTASRALRVARLARDSAYAGEIKRKDNKCELQLRTGCLIKATTSYVTPPDGLHQGVEFSQDSFKTCSGF